MILAIVLFNRLMKVDDTIRPALFGVLLIVLVLLPLLLAFDTVEWVLAKYKIGRDGE